MTINQRLKLINNTKTKLDLIYSFSRNFESYDKAINSYIACSFNFSDIYEYFKPTFDLLDINTKITKSYKDSFFQFFGLLQVVYVQQDLIDAIANAFGVNLENTDDKKLNRNLRNQLVGHPLSEERNSDERNDPKWKIKSESNRKSTIILKSITPKKVYYVNYETENSKNQYTDMCADVDEIIERHLAFLNASFDSILKRILKEINVLLKKLEKYLRLYYCKTASNTNKFSCWFSLFINTHSFDVPKLNRCIEKKGTHIRYEVYLKKFESMLVNYYLELIVSIKKFTVSYNKVCSYRVEIKHDKLMLNSLKRKNIAFNSFFKGKGISGVGRDLRDISKPFNDQWHFGFNQLTTNFSNNIELISELNHLKILRFDDDELEYEICYDYIEYLLGY